MNERDVIIEYIKTLLATPVAWIFLILDLAGVVAVIYWVVDDLLEGGVVTIFLVVVLTSQYFVFRKVRRELYVHQQAQPRIQFTQARQAQMYHDSPIVKDRTPTYQLLQAWFVNVPQLPTESSVAKNVTARIKFFTGEQREIVDYHGQWARSNAPDNVGFDDILDEIEIPPGHLQAKLIIVLKYPSDPECYAFTRESMRSTPDGRLPRYRIPDGDYHVGVHLRGVGINEQYWFDFSNPGVGNPLELTQSPRL